MEAIELPITRGLKTTIDQEDLPRVAPFRLFATKQPSGHLYVLAKPRNDPKGRLLRLHRFLLNAPPDKCVDHINGDGLDNRKANLRLCTNAENRRNSRRHRDSSSRYKGVSFYWGKWVATVSVNGSTRHLGVYMAAEDAASAYNIGATELHGEFARLNELPEQYYDHPRADCAIYQYLEGFGPLVGQSGRHYCCLCWREITP